MDEHDHDPQFNPSHIPDELLPMDWGSFFAAIGRAVLFGLAAAGIAQFLGGCDSAEYDRLQAAAYQRDRIARACVPEEGQKVIVTRDGQTIYYRRIQTSPRYGRDFPHVEVKLNLIEEL